MWLSLVIFSNDKLLYVNILEINTFKSNSAAPDQTMQNVASDQGLHCLQIV